MVKKDMVDMDMVDMDMDRCLTGVSQVSPRCIPDVSQVSPWCLPLPGRDSKSGERGEHALAIFLPLLC